MFKYQYKYHLVACFQQVDFKTSFGHHLSFVQSLQKLWELLSFSSLGSPASPILCSLCGFVPHCKDGTRSTLLFFHCSLFGIKRIVHTLWLDILHYLCKPFFGFVCLWQLMQAKQGKENRRKPGWQNWHISQRRRRSLVHRLWQKTWPGQDANSASNPQL